MDQRLVEIFLASSLTLIAGVFLCYLGFFSPIFRRSSELVAPDASVGTFRLIARIMGILLCTLAALKIADDIHRQLAPQSLHWQTQEVPEGHFRVAVPAEFSKDSRDVPYGEWRASEHFCRALLPRIGFLVSYLDLPERLRELNATEVLDHELDLHVHAAGVQLIDRHSTTFVDHPAVKFKLHDVPGGFYVEGYLFLVGARRYQLAVQYTDESMSAARKQFFDSFELSGKE